MLIKCVYSCWLLIEAVVEKLVLKAAAVHCLAWSASADSVSCNLRPEPSSGTCGGGPGRGNDKLV